MIEKVNINGVVYNARLATDEDVDNIVVVDGVRYVVEEPDAVELASDEDIAGFVEKVSVGGKLYDFRDAVDLGDVTSLDEITSPGVYSGRLRNTPFTMKVDTYTINRSPRLVQVVQYPILLESRTAMKVNNSWVFGDWNTVNAETILDSIKDKVVAIDGMDVVYQSDDVDIEFDTLGNYRTNITIGAATENSAGVMSAEDKKKLDRLSEGGGGDITATPTEEVIEEIEPNLVSTALRKTPQVLTDSEKEIARGNIGAVSYAQLTSAINNAITETLNTAV